MKAIIFDCFGVLINDALTGFVEEMKKADPEVARQIYKLIAASNRGLIEQHEYRVAVAELLGLTFDEYMSKLTDGEIKNEALLEYIMELRKQYKIGMLSNVSKGGMSLRFTDDELQQYFDAVVISGDVGYAKPEAQAYEIIASRLNVRLDECIMIDDREEYIEGATGVGMQTILYITNEQMKEELVKLLTE